MSFRFTFENTSCPNPGNCNSDRHRPPAAEAELRSTLKALAKKLDFNETQTVLYAMARLRDEVFVEPDIEKFMPLTKTRRQAIAAAEPRRKGKVIGSLL